MASSLRNNTTRPAASKPAPASSAAKGTTGPRRPASRAPWPSLRSPPDDRARPVPAAVVLGASGILLASVVGTVVGSVLTTVVGTLEELGGTAAA